MSLSVWNLCCGSNLESKKMGPCAIAPDPVDFVAYFPDENIKITAS